MKLALAEMYVQGVSTRKVATVLVQTGGADNGTLPHVEKQIVFMYRALVES